MGCDIHAYAERREGSKWVPVDIPLFDWRSYSLFGWLAGVRNYSAVPPISEVRGLPADACEYTTDEYEKWYGDAHSASWLSVEELEAFDYDQPVEDRRITVQTGPNSWNGGATAEPGGGTMTTFREFLGSNFFDEIAKAKAVGAERIVFWFDN